MPHLMEVTVCNIGVFFEAYYIKDIVPVGYLPGIYISGVSFPVTCGADDML